ncbi:MAG: serine/threonine-protein kinase [Planctomycetia bacterium]|nr:serine/threonine-protein kinase [Planctomycetia bacterium]
MSNNNELHFLRMISQNQLGRTTWEAEYQGKKCIAKKIELGSVPKKEKLIQILNRQVRFNTNLMPEDHGRIVLFHHMIPSNGYIAFLRDFVEGDTLAEYLTAGTAISWQDAVSMIQEIATIVACAHNRYSLIHGDLKPENIILNKDGEVCIIDWDSMRISSETENFLDRTVTVESMGTPYYMAPEQCTGQKITEKTDVYALGTILYQMVAGQVPFAKVSLREVWATKQSQNPRPIQVDFPHLQLPTELTRLIDESLLMDQNSRIPSVHEFLSRLRSVSGTCSSEESSNPIPPTSSFQQTTTVQPQMSRQEILADKTPAGNVVLVGHTQAGKTVLAVGLYATSSTKFSVTPLDDETQSFVDNTKSTLDQNAWPSATQGTVANLSFKLLLQGSIRKRAAIVSFKEYGGERVSTKSYYQEIVGKPEGVLLLFNPYTLQKRDAYEINKLITETKRCIDYLCNLPRKPQVAVVITAADTLESSARDFKPKFEKIVNEITNTLTLSNCTWKRFEVSVCKPLADQNHPELEPQHIQEPFVWLLDKKEAAANRSFAMKWGLRVAALFILLLSICGIRSSWEGARTSNIRRSLVEIDKKYTSATLVEQKEAYFEELNSIVKRTPKYSFWFSSKNKAFQEQKNRLLQKTDDAYYQLLLKQQEEIAKESDPISKFNEVTGSIDAWNPLIKENTKFKTELSQKQRTMIPDIVKRCVPSVQNAKDKKFDDQYKNVLGFVQRYKTTNPELVTMFANQIAPLKETKLQARIRTFAGTTEQLRELIKDCKMYLVEECQKPFPESDLASSLVSLCGKRIQKEIDTNVEKASDLANEFQMDSKVINEYLAIVKESGFSATDVKELQGKAGALETEVEQAKNNAEKDAVYDFLRTVENISAEDALTELKGWLLDKGFNIREEMRKRAEEKIVEKIRERMEFLRKNCVKNCEEGDYRKLNELCVSVAASPSKYIQGNLVYNFAKRYSNWLENESTVTIQLVSLEATCSYTYGGYIWKINGQVGSRYWYWTGEKYYTNKKSIPVQVPSQRCRPWEPFEIDIETYIDDDLFSDSGKDRRLMFYGRYSGESDTVSYEFPRTNTTLYLRFRVDGITLADIVKEIFGEK